MTKELEIAIEELYQRFAKYPLRSQVEGCPCCVSESDKLTLHSKPLRDLEDEDISRYAFKAMTTWGDVKDFKHYLPRIFELLATRKLMVDNFVVLGKLDYGKWEEWEEQERATILNFLRSWWKYAINHNGFFDSDLLIEINKKIKNISLLLDDWDVSIESPGFRNYVELIEMYYYELKGKNTTFRALNNQELQAFDTWIVSKSANLEEGFFKYEVEDKAFSEMISDALYMIDILK